MCRCCAEEIVCCCCSCAINMLLSVLCIVLVIAAIVFAAIYYGLIDPDKDANANLHNLGDQFKQAGQSISHKITS